jgi:hypothetical protein
MHIVTRLPPRLAAWAALAGALAGATCRFPTDKSDQVFVTVTPSDSLLAAGVLGQGQSALLSAKAWRLLENGDSVRVVNVDFSWSSDDNTIARVERKSGGSAEVTGQNFGTVAIRAKAATFEQSIDAAVPVRVAPSFVIDSVRPLTTGFGGKLTVYGVRINQIFSLSLGIGSLFRDDFSFTGSTEGLGRIDYWVPFPSSSDHPFFLGPGMFGSVTDSVDVLPEDIYEPNYAMPAPVDINGAGGPRTFLGFPTLYFNPALYYEPYDPTTDGPFAIDWYRFARTDTTADVTFILSSEVFDDTAFQYFADTIAFNSAILNYEAPGWLNSPGNGFYACDGQLFGAFRETRTPTTIVALRGLPGKAVHLFSNYGKDGPYSVVVVAGYLVQDRRIGPDRFEENDNWCRYANVNFGDNSTDSTSPNKKRIVVGLPAGFGQNGPWLDSTLTIDNAHDIDWYRFRVQPAVLPGLPDTMTIVRTKPRPLPGIGLDFSDIDIYVLRASDATYMGTSTTIGSNESIVLNLPPDDYFLAVVDAASTPTRYAVCIAKGGAGVTCAPPGSAPPATIAPSLYKIPWLSPRDPRRSLGAPALIAPR